MRRRSDSPSFAAQDHVGLARRRLCPLDDRLLGLRLNDCEDDHVPQRGTPVGRVRALYRYPVKSTAGQSLEWTAVTAEGLGSDRRWAAYTDDGGVASGKRTRRFRPVIGLMGWASSAQEDHDVPVLVSPEGVPYPVDVLAASAALTAAFGEADAAARVHGPAPRRVADPSADDVVSRCGRTVGWCTC